MWGLATLNDFSERIDWHLNKAVQAAEMAVRDVKAEAVRHNALGSSSVDLSIFEAVYKAFEEGLEKALDETRRAAEMIHFEIEDIKRITEDKLLTFTNQMKLVCCPPGVQQFRTRANANIVKLGKFDELQQFMLKQFGAGFLVPPKPQMLPMKNDIRIENMHGGAIQQGTTASSQIVSGQTALSVADLDRLRDFLAQTKAALPLLPDKTKGELQPIIEGLETETAQEKPDGMKVKAFLQSARVICEAAAGNLAASGILALITGLAG